MSEPKLEQSVFVTYPDGNYRWLCPTNEKLRGGKINGLRPDHIYLLNPTQLLEESAHWLAGTTGKVHVTIGGRLV